MLSAVRAKLNTQQEVKKTDNPYVTPFQLKDHPPSKSLSNEFTLILNPLKISSDLSTKIPEKEWFDVPGASKTLKLTPKKTVKKSTILSLNSAEKAILKKNKKLSELQNLSDQKKVDLEILERFFGVFEIFSFSHPIFLKQIKEKCTKLNIKCLILILNREDLGFPATIFIEGSLNKIERFEKMIEKIDFKKKLKEENEKNNFLEKNFCKKIFCRKISENLITKKFSVKKVKKTEYFEERQFFGVNDFAEKLDFAVDPLAGLF